jgi:hypothetical protein
MNPLPRYTADKLSTLSADAQVGSIADASGFRVAPYQGSLNESVAAAPGNRDPLSRLHSLALRRRISAVGAKKRRPSLTTPGNQLALRLASQIENRIQTILLVSRRGARNRLREIEPDVPEKEHQQFLTLLRKARDNPISAANRSKWNSLLTEFVLIIDPTLERSPELKKVRSAKGPKYIKREEVRFRSELLKLFDDALKNLLGM